LPRVKDGVEHVYHLFVVRHPNRDELRLHLSEFGVGSQIHYPVPCHLQQAYEFLGVPKGRLPITENYAQTVLSLPNYPELTDDEVLYICDVLNKF
jgi:dTDP-4-amino-4,6-dideoxygalactose transaminase